MPNLRRTLPILLVGLLVLGSRPAGAVEVPPPVVTNDFTTVHGEIVTGLPSTPTCTTTVVTDKRFHNSAYAGPTDPDPANHAFTGDYGPSCPGPWSRVVMTMSAYVKTGTQFDRIGDVMLGGVELLHFTTPEGEGGTTRWSIDRDVTEAAALFTQRQPTYFMIGNQTDDTYTGDFYGTLRFTFYGTGPGASADAGATYLEGTGLGTFDPGQALSKQVTFPRNLMRLSADVFTSGHGAEEEDWWDAPGACSGTGNLVPYREAGVSIDGRLVGIAPMYPTIYTGGFGPDFWRPIPSPRALNLRPYRLDLTPFIGLVSDGSPHTVTTKIINHDGSCAGYWYLATNLVGTRNPLSGVPTTGTLDAYTANPLPTNTTVGSTAISTTRTTSEHHLAATGTVSPIGVLPLTASIVEGMTNTANVVALAVTSDWTWDRTTTVLQDGHTTVDTADATFQLVRDLPHWQLVDTDATTRARDGVVTRTTSLNDRMNTGGPVVGITGVVGTSAESWTYKTSDGVCVDHELVGAANDTLYDNVGQPVGGCPARLADVEPPVPAIPEVPFGVLLPLSAAAAIGAVMVLRRRSEARAA